MGPGMLKKGVKLAASFAKIPKATKFSKNKLPIQIHHFATNKHRTYTKQMANIANKYGLDLHGEWNKAAMPHLGRHTHAYHEFVLRGMEEAAIGAGSNRSKFLRLFNKYVRKPVLQNPNLLQKPR